MIFRICMLLLVCSNLNNYVSAQNPCCGSTNIVFDNFTCWDGSNITVLTCEFKKFKGPEHDSGLDFDIDEDGYLQLQENEDNGYVSIDPTKYCLTKKFGNKQESTLVCYNREETPQPEERVQLTYAKNACALITLVLLVLIFIIYFFVKDLRDLEGQCILNFVGPIIVVHTIATFLKVISLINPESCVLTSSIYFFAFFCSYNWLTVLSYHLWRITIQSLYQTQARWTLIYYGYGYGIPVLLVITALGFHGESNQDLRPGSSQCWYESGAYTVLAYFYGPVFITLLISSVLQLWAAKKVWIDVDSRIEYHFLASLRKKSVVYLHILLIFILIMVTDIITFIFLHESDALDYLWDIFDCRNYLVGGVLFFILVVLRNKVLKALGKQEQLLCITFPYEWKELVDEESETFYNENFTNIQITKI